jgi:hypothetical protein
MRVSDYDMPEIIRHGDLLLMKVDSVPKDASVLNTLTLAEGEATGHHHTITSGQALIYAPATVTDDVAKYIEVKSKTAELTHQEHKPVELTQGAYKLSIEREYNPTDKVIRKVLD